MFGILKIFGINYLDNPEDPNKSQNPMIISGLQKFSLLDYPDHLSAIIFTQGCNFRCQFCYNPMLVWPRRLGKSKYINSLNGERQKGHPNFEEDDLFAFLKSRKGKLDGVVITGGEPTMQKNLINFIAEIKKLGFAVKLDTNGTNPAMLKKLIEKKLIDYLAMDLKAPADKYKAVTGKNIDFNKIKRSVKIIRDSGLPYEFRTTVVPGILIKDDIKKMGLIIEGADKWYLQAFKSNTELVQKKLIGKKAYSQKEMSEMAEIGRRYVKKCEVR